MSAGHPRDMLFFSNPESLCLKVPLVQEHKMDYTEKGMEEVPLPWESSAFCKSARSVMALRDGLIDPRREWGRPGEGE